MFEWDEDKNRTNREKHGLAFEDVLAAFARREALTLEDRRKDYGEPRYVVLCPLEDVLVHVTYTVRGGIIRLISARRASRRDSRRTGRSHSCGGSSVAAVPLNRI